MAALKKGSMVEFTSFAEGEDQPKNGELLVVGGVYKIAKVNMPKKDSNDVLAYVILASDAEGNDVEVDLFHDECKVATKKAIAAAKKATTAAAKEVEQSEKVDESAEGIIELVDLEKGMDVALIPVDPKNEKDVLAEGRVANITAKQIHIEEEDMDGNVKLVKVNKALVDVIEAIEYDDETTESGEAGSEEAGSEEVGSGEAGSSEEDDGSNLPALTEEEEDQELLSIFNDTDDLIALAKEISEESIHTDWKLGAVLTHVRKDRQYRDLNEEYKGKGGFRRFCLAELNSLDYRRAMDLISVYTQFCKHGLGADDLNEMGYAKAVLIQRDFEGADVDQLVDAAKASTVAELRETIKETRVTRVTEAGTRDVVRMTRIAFSVPEQAGKNIMAAIHLAMEQEDKTLPEAIEHMIRTYTEDHLDPKAITRIKRRLAKEAQGS